MYVCVSGSKTCSFFRKFDFEIRPFALLPMTYGSDISEIIILDIKTAPIDKSMILPFSAWHLKLSAQL